jgi:hypothetical protein
MQTAITVAFFVVAILCLLAAFGFVAVASVEAGFLFLAGIYLGAKAAERLP